MIRLWLPLAFAFALVGCERQSDFQRDVAYEEVPVGTESEDPEPSPATVEAERTLRLRGAQLTVAESVSGFRVMHGRNPANLTELVTEEVIDELPDLPEGYEYDYDPSTGEVEVVPVDE